MAQLGAGWEAVKLPPDIHGLLRKTSIRLHFHGDHH